VHELIALCSSWSASLYGWARTLIGIVLWFWVVSGAIFGVRFLAFVLTENHNGSSPLAAGSAHLPFVLERYSKGSRSKPSQK
jgi:hypothetical protein